jgi:uncharacterized Zn-binding protein involved in type VI secretion
MGKPAARMGDTTAHGGTIVLGFPMVLIGGQPAARITDMHVCPMVTPAIPPIPHVGGPITLGSPMVLIGGLPAARMGDMAVCTGPPDSIVMGCMTVLIGEGGSGGGGGGSPSGGAPSLGVGVSTSSGGETVFDIGTAMIEGGGTNSAKIGAGIANNLQGNLSFGTGTGITITERLETTQSQTPIKEEHHWIEFNFNDSSGEPISGVPCQFTSPDGKQSEFFLSPLGIKWYGKKGGTGKAKLMFIRKARWSQAKARVGDKVKLIADVEGYNPGTEAVFEIYKRDLFGADIRILVIRTKTESNKVEAEWEYQYPDDINDIEDTKRIKYTNPEYYFIVKVGQQRARSEFLEYQDWIDIELRDDDDKPIGNEEYILYLPNGEIRNGKLDQNGHRREENLPPGKCRVVFPKFDDVVRI